MQIILLHDVDKVGRRGESYSVTDGYARNYLFPQGLAVRADTAKKKELEMRLKALEVRDVRDHKAAEEMASGLENVSVKIESAASDEGKLYGSVTAQMVATALADKGHAIEARQVELSEALKELGTYSVPVRVHRDVVVEIQVWVEKQD